MLTAWALVLTGDPAAATYPMESAIITLEAKGAVRLTCTPGAGGEDCLEVDVDVTRRETDETTVRETHHLSLAPGFVAICRQAYGERAEELFATLLPLVDRARRGRRPALAEAAAVARDELRQAQALHYFTTLPDVQLTPAMASTADAIGERFYGRTGLLLVVTSGARDPWDQAAALHTKLALGEDIVRLYRDRQAAAEIRDAYRRARRAKADRRARIEAMAAVIRAQVERGTLISRHLTGRALDMRSRTMTARQRDIFRSVAEDTPTVRRVLLEQVPPHFHLEIE